MKLCSIASGSSGNCIFVGNDTTKLLVDVGISGKKIENGLKELGVSLEEIDAILITHEHIDHIKGLGVMARRYHWPIYTTQLTKEAILNTSSVGKLEEDLFHRIEPDEPFFIGKIKVVPVSTWHDAADPVCYTFYYQEVKVSIATDLGDFDDYLVGQLNDSDMLFIEANHDVNMLEVGPYPYSLKRRILGSRGHLSNERAGQLISKLNGKRLHSVLIGHLSKENNYEALAYETVKQELNKEPSVLKQLQLFVAKRDGLSQICTVSK